MIFTGKKISAWKKIRGQILLHTKFARVDKDQVRLPSGERINYYITSRNIRAVAVIARDEKNKVCIQREFRYPTGRIMYEFPGGIVERNESFLQAAKRELMEEAGVRARKWTLVGKYFGSPSQSNMIYAIYLATEIQKSNNKPEKGEYLQHCWCTTAELRNLIKKGKIQGQGFLAAYALLSVKGF